MWAEFMCVGVSVHIGVSHSAHSMYPQNFHMQTVPTQDIRHTQTSMVAGRGHPMGVKTQCHVDTCGLWDRVSREADIAHLFQPTDLLRDTIIISTRAKMMASLGST